MTSGTSADRRSRELLAFALVLAGGIAAARLGWADLRARSAQAPEAPAASRPSSGSPEVAGVRLPGSDSPPGATGPRD